MNFRNQLLAEPSRANTDFMVAAINGEKELFEQLFPLIYDSNGYVANRAAWVLEKCAAKYPWLVEPHLNEIIDQLRITNFDGSRRLLLKVLTLIPIPESREGEIIDFCLTSVESTKEKVGLKSFAIKILEDFCKKEPAIIPELIAILENNYEYNTMAFKSRADKVFRKFGKKN